jgi:hypothetical protein
MAWLPGGPVAVNGSGTYPLPYVITQAQGTHSITAVFSSMTAGILGSLSGASNLVVSRENASVTLSSTNPVAVQVNSPGGNASAITLSAAIQELADGSLGNISNATPVTLTLVPVVAAPSINCTVGTSVASGVLTATALCGNVPVNVYDVSIRVGGNYYTGSADSVVAVYDPSLGFVTGGGTLVHGVPAHFGANVKYLKNGQQQGGVMYIEHRATGDLILKSNAVQSLSIVDNTAVILGKATLGGVGNYSFQATLIDNGQPGTNSLFGLQVKDPSGVAVPNLSFSPMNLGGGTIQVPHK